MSISSQEWWETTKKSQELLHSWLMKQYRGEVTAAERIRSMKLMTEDGVNLQLLDTIAAQEELHARWVKGLLESRGIVPAVIGAEERYWKEVLPAAVDFYTACAVAAHAEGMRLERIKVISSDPEAPVDIRRVFADILAQEVFHETAFRNMAGPIAMSKVKPDHERGRELLGLEV